MTHPRRSLLFMPGSNARALEKARVLPADGLILDIEDSVAPDAKAKAPVNTMTPPGSVLISAYTQRGFAYEAKGDFKERFAAFRKIGELRKETYEKIAKSLTDDQKKTWKDLGGKEFEIKIEKGKGFGKKKDD